MNELWQAIYSRGTATAAGSYGVYDSIAPQNAALPYVVFQQQAWGVEALDPRRREDAYVSIRAISQTGFAQAGSIDAAIDTAFDNMPLSVSGHTNIWLKRTEQIRYVETADDKRYYHQGGIYRIRLTH